MRSRLFSSTLAAAVAVALSATLAAQERQGAPGGQGGGRGGGRGGFAMVPMLLESDAYADGAIVPAKYAAAGGSTMPSSLALINSVHHGPARARAMGWWSMVSAGAPVVGLTVGGPVIDAVGWPILQQFGDPLVMDSRLDADGRIRVLVTPRMNAVLGGAVAAAVVTCDFYARTLFPSSNVGEYVYAQVPTTMEDGFAPGYYSVLFEDPDGIRIEANFVPGKGHFDPEKGRIGAAEKGA